MSTCDVCKTKDSSAKEIDGYFCLGLVRGYDVASLSTYNRVYVVFYSEYVYVNIDNGCYEAQLKEVQGILVKPETPTSDIVHEVNVRHGQRVCATCAGKITGIIKATFTDKKERTELLISDAERLLRGEPIRPERLMEYSVTASRRDDIDAPFMEFNIEADSFEDAVAEADRRLKDEGYLPAQYIITRGDGTQMHREINVAK